jgi:putative transposase
MRKSRFSDEQIIGILKEHQAGLSAAEVCGKLKRLLADAMLDVSTLREMLGKNF